MWSQRPGVRRENGLWRREVRALGLLLTWIGRNFANFAQANTYKLFMNGKTISTAFAAAGLLVANSCSNVVTDEFTGLPVRINPSVAAEEAKKGADALPKEFYLALVNEENHLHSYEALMKNEDGKWVSYDASTGERIQMLWANGIDYVKWTASTSDGLVGGETISVAKDQTTADSLRASDHLYRAGYVHPMETDGCIDMELAHMLSKIDIAITLGSGHRPAANPVSNVEISGIQTVCLCEDTLFSAMNPFVISAVKPRSSGYAAGSNPVATYEAILIPQTIPEEFHGNQLAVKFRLNDNEYWWRSSDTIRLEPNTRYTLALKAGKDRVVASSLTAAKWHQNASPSKKAK